MPLVIVCVLIFIGMTELVPTLEGITLSWPMSVAAGLMLAIASNYTKPAALPWKRSYPLPVKPPVPSAPSTPTLTVDQSTPLPQSAVAAVSPEPQREPVPQAQVEVEEQRSPQLPKVSPSPERSDSTISFTIRRPSQ